MTKEYKVYDGSGVEIFSSDDKIVAESYTYAGVSNHSHQKPLILVRGEMITMERGVEED